MYKLARSRGVVIRKSDGASIPADTSNKDYREYLEWVIGGGVPEPAQTEDELKAEERARKKELREKKVESIVVDVEGLLFDGDETSQNRMARTIVAMQTTGAVTIPWTMADNRVVVVTQTQLSQALLKAGQEQSSVWTL